MDSTDPKQEFLSDGISGSIITALSKMRRLLVIDRNSTFTYKGGRLIRFKKADVDRWMEGQRKECVDVARGARKILRASRGPALDINRVVKKAIDQGKRFAYTASHGKPDRIKGLGKEVPDGTV